MSNHRAIAEVTKTLQEILQSSLALDEPDVSAKVTSKPPDKARSQETGNQLNLFLYRLSINPAMRNDDAREGRPQIGPPALPLVLSYVVTAYGDGDDDLLAQRVLGVAVSALHDQPVLSRAALAEAGLSSGIDTQLEQVKITPGPIPQDELSRMWSTFGTGYRISVTYDVSVVMIDSTLPRTSPAPVLSRGAEDSGPHISGALAPMFTALSPSPLRPDPQQAFGLEFALHGSNLGGVESLTVTGSVLTDPMPIEALTVATDEVRVSLPKDALPAGSFVMVANLPDVPAASSEVPFAVAPAIVEESPLTAKLAGGSATIKLTCTPATVHGQRVALIVRDQVFPGTVPDQKDHPDRLSFRVQGLEKKRYPIRLRVDGQDSLRLQDGRLGFHELELT